MRLFSLLLALFILSILGGCAAQRPAVQAHHVDSQGNVSVATRSALNGSLAPGQQELIGIYLPFPPFAVKAGLEWDGTSFNWGGAPPQVSRQSASPCVEEYFVTETYTEHVPVQRTRQVPQRRVTLPVPQQVDPCAPAPVRYVNPCPAPPPPPPEPIAFFAKNV